MPILSNTVIAISGNIKVFKGISSAAAAAAFFFFPANQYMEFPGQGSNASCSCDLR